MLSLGENNSNENEAQSAILKAQKMMAKHGLSMGEVEFSENGKENGVEEINLTKFYNIKRWHWELADIIASNFRCIWYKSRPKDGKRSIKFIGLKEDLEIAKAVYFFAVESIEYFKTLDMIKFKRQNRDKKYGKGDENDYINGYLKGLKEKLAEQKAKKEFALVLVTPQEVKDRAKERGLISKKARPVKSAGNKDAFNKGYKRGKAFEYGSKTIAE